MPRSSSPSSARLSALTTGLLLLGVVAGLALGLPALERRAAIVKREPVRVVIEWPPLTGASTPGTATDSWLSERYQQQLTALAQEALTDNPFDHASLEASARALVDTGWIVRVRAIRRESGGIVRVTADWRTPAAVVRHGDYDHLVSTEGELLPVQFKHATSGMRVIINPAFPPPEHPGEMWVGGDVQAALALMAHVQTHPAWAQVAAIDAERYAKSHRLAFLTDRGTRVVWGSPPGETRVGEPTTRQKLSNLDRLMTDPAFGRRIDAGQPLVDLSNPRGVIIDASAQPVQVPLIVPADHRPGSTRQEAEGEPTDALDADATLAEAPTDAPR